MTIASHPLLVAAPETRLDDVRVTRETEKEI
jgi:hypothetical protein